MHPMDSSRSCPTWCVTWYISCKWKVTSGMRISCNHNFDMVSMICNNQKEATKATYGRYYSISAANVPVIPAIKRRGRKHKLAHICLVSCAWGLAQKKHTPINGLCPEVYHFKLQVGNCMVKCLPWKKFPTQIKWWHKGKKIGCNSSLWHPVFCVWELLFFFLSFQNVEKLSGMVAPPSCGVYGSEILGEPHSFGGAISTHG